MKIKINESQLSLLGEQQYNYDKNDVKRTIPKNVDLKVDDTTLQASKRHPDTDKVWEPSSEEEDKINKVRSKLLFFFDKTLDKIVQLEKDIIKEKYGSDSYTKSEDYKNPFNKLRTMDPNKVVQPKKIGSADTDRVLFSEKKLVELKGSLENVKEMLKDKKKLLELYDEGVFSVKPHTPKHPLQKGGDPDMEPSRNVIRKHMLLLRKEIENLDGIENKTPEQMELLQKYKTEYEKEFDSSILY